MIDIELIPSKTRLSKTVHKISDTEIQLKPNFQKQIKSKDKLRITLNFAEFMVMDSTTMELNLDKLVEKKKRKGESNMQKGGKVAL